MIYVDGIELVNRGYDQQRKMGREIVCKGVSMDAEIVKPFVFSDIIFPGEDTSPSHLLKLYIYIYICCILYVY